MWDLICRKSANLWYLPSCEYSQGFSFLEPSKLWWVDIDDIHELEKDMWSRWLWEYILCKNCNTIYGKGDVYTDFDMPEKSMTISELENYFWITDISCPGCGWNTDFIFWESYKEDIEKRYSNKKSIILVYRDVIWKIRWIFDGYTSTYDDIYDKEFLWYYGEELRSKIQEKIEEKLWEKRDLLFCPSTLWTDQRHQSLQTIFTLMRMFYQKVSDTQGDIHGVYQSVLGTNMHAIYEVTWAVPLWFWGVSCLRWKTHQNFPSDIFIHQNIGKNSSLLLWNTLRGFLSKNKSAIKKIVEKPL